MNLKKACNFNELQAFFCCMCGHDLCMNLKLDDEQAFVTVATLFHEMTHQLYVIPLLHHWMEFVTEKSFTWRDLNTLGWPDFSQLWLE